MRTKFVGYRELINLIIWFFYLLLFPYQFFPPGNLQICDYLMVFGILINAKSFKITLKRGAFEYWFFLFISYSFVVNSFFSAIENDFSFIKSSLNYFYCFCVFFFILKISEQYLFLFYTKIFIFITFVTLIIFFPLKISQDGIFRGQMYFNNPNQLGLWALILLVITLLNPEDKSISIIKYISIFIAILFIIYSISQAAIISAALLLLYNFIKSIRSFIIVTLVLLGSFFVVESKYNQDWLLEFDIFSNLGKRFENEKEDDGDNSLEGRGYDRIWENPKFLIFGAGEGKFSRFDSGFEGMELHSSLGSILFCYGLIGFFPFFIIHFLVFRNSNLSGKVLLVSIIIFTLVHMVLRWPLYYLAIYFINRFSFKIKSIV